MLVSPYFVEVVGFEETACEKTKTKQTLYILQERKEEKLALVVCLATRQLFCKMRCNLNHPHACLPIINVLLN